MPAPVAMPEAPKPHGGSALKYAVTAVIVIAALGIAGFAVWFFAIQKPSTTTTGEQQAPPATEPTTTVPAETAPAPSETPLPESSSSQTAVPGEMPTASSSEPMPVTVPPPGTNIPPPEGFGAPTTTSEASSTAFIDSDNDGLSDQREIELGTDPRNPDTDGDGLSDGDEVLKYGTNPLNPDTDGDGYPDGVEVRGGYNPRGPGKCAKPDCTI